MHFIYRQINRDQSIDKSKNILTGQQMHVNEHAVDRQII